MNELLVVNQIDNDYAEFLTLVELINVIKDINTEPEIVELFGDKLRLVNIDINNPIVNQPFEVETSEETLGVAIAVEIVIEILFKTIEAIYASKTNKAIVKNKKLVITHREDYDETYANSKVKTYSYEDTLLILQKGIPVMNKIFDLSIKDFDLDIITELIHDVDCKLLDGKLVTPDIKYESDTIKNLGWNSDTLESIHPLMVEAAKSLRVLSTHIRQVAKNAKDTNSTNTENIIVLRKLTSFLLPIISRSVLKHIVILKLSKRNYLANT